VAVAPQPVSWRLPGPTAGERISSEVRVVLTEMDQFSTIRESGFDPWQYDSPEHETTATSHPMLRIVGDSDIPEGVVAVRGKGSATIQSDQRYARECW
jgi:hypothetical protein